MIFIVFLYGIVFGSFLNVCIYRIPNEESIVRGRSHCPKCNHKLSWIDLIPIVSFLTLKGKCRYCKAKVSPRYPLIESFTGILVVLIYIRYGITFEFFKYFTLTLFLIVIAFIDYDTTDVYTSVIYTGIGFGMIFIILGKVMYSYSILNYLIAVLIGLGVIGGICLFIGGMGTGDIEIAVLCGIYLGWKLEIAFILFSFIIGGIFAVTLIITKKKKKTDYIPLGPSLALGAYLVIIIGENLITRLSGLG